MTKTNSLVTIWYLGSWTTPSCGS